MRKNEVGKHSKFKFFSNVFLVSFLLVIVMLSYVQQNDMYNKLSEAKTELAEYKSENVRLESVLEAQASVKNIEQYAEETLGMEKLDSSQIKYITLQENDIVELPEEEENLFVRMRIQFEEFIDYLRG